MRTENILCDRCKKVMSRQEVEDGGFFKFEDRLARKGQKKGFAFAEWNDLCRTCTDELIKLLGFDND